MPLAEIVAQQETWAISRWPSHTGRRAPTLAQNLFCPLTPEFEAQFGSGSGGELGSDGVPGKMQSLRSSSALAFNAFAPWHRLDQTALADALGQTILGTCVCFEKKYAHGLSSGPPNLDVVLDVGQERPLAIESKFTEPYGKKRDRPPLATKYFDGDRQRWTELDMPRCQALAAAVGKSVRYHRLDVAQLLKHLLGLAYSTQRKPRLVCVWFDSDCEEAREHGEELERFGTTVGADVDFSHVSYQRLWQSLRSSQEPMLGYHEYMRTRYSAA